MATETLRPTGVGTYEEVNSSTSGAGLHWQDVDEAVANGLTDRIREDAGAYATDTFAFGNLSVSGITISSLTYYFNIKKDGADNARAKPAFYIGAALYYGTDIGMTTAFAEYSEVFNTSPATAAAWTEAEVNAMECGAGLLSAAPTSTYCTQVYVIVTYTLNPTKIPTGASCGVHQEF